MQWMVAPESTVKELGRRLRLWSWTGMHVGSQGSHVGQHAASIQNTKERNAVHLSVVMPEYWQIGRRAPQTRIQRPH